MPNAVVAAAFLAAILGAAEEPAQIEEESSESKFVRLTRQLEADPFSDSDKAIRTWLIDWASESSSVTVTICDVLGPVPGEEVPFGSTLLTQMIFGNAAFQIENPTQRADTIAVQTAGVRSSLNAYRSILSTHPEASIDYFDTLAKQQDANTLDSYLKPIIEKGCEAGE